jgi:cysteine desulfurase
MGRAYLDHASTSPLRPEARAALIGQLDAGLGDPGRIHAEGMTARVALETAREQVAALLGARSREVVFTSGATEAIATAVWGASERGGHQVVPAVEHSAVRMSTARVGDVTVVPVDGFGRVDPEAVIAAIRPDTALVHVQWGNHEVGTVQPVDEIVAACRQRGVLVHVDAAQAAGRVPIDFHGLGADLLSVSGHKLGGPAGTGALLIRRGLRLRALLVGGDQERERRAGLEDVAALAGFGAAAETLAADDRLEVEAAADRRRTDRVLDAVPGLDGVVVYGDPHHRLPHLVCLGVRGIEPQAVLLGLDRAGVAAHAGSACSSASLEPSPVLEAMGVDAHHSLRISVGWSTVDDDIDRLLAVLPPIIADLRALAPGS